MENNKSLWPKKYNRPILLLSFLTMAVSFISFGEMSVSLWFLVFHFLTIVLFLYCLKSFYEKSKTYSTNKFEKKLFTIGLLIRTASILFFYLLFYVLTNTEFDIAAQDAVWYHDTGIKIAKQLSEFRFNRDDLGSSIDFDDLGYNLFLGGVYFIFGPIVIIARIIQAIFGSFSAVLIYRIGKSLYNENVGRMASVLFLFFPLFIYFNVLHLKETLMLFLTLLSLGSIINFQTKKNKVKHIAVFFLTILLTFSFRAVLSYTLLATFFLTLLITNKFKLYHKLSIGLFSLVFLVLFGWQIGLLDEFSGKFIKYINKNSESSLMDNSAERMVNSGQTFAKFASGPVILVQSVSFPYPSMVKTNLGDYGQADQWYHISSLFLWAFLSYWAILGIYDSARMNWRENFPLLCFTVLFSLILVITLYITSVRFNILKMAPMLIFVAVGLNNNSLRRQKYWSFYMVWMCVVIMVWNYAKIAGRGLI